MSHNLYFGNSVDLATDETNKSVGNPLFVNPGNGPNGYMIQSGSPAIASGIALPSTPNMDYYGNTIDRNGPISIGIQQFSGETNSRSNKDIDEVSASEVKLYPNPIASSTTIENAANSVVTIYDVDSSVLFTQTISNNNETINLSDLSTGIYFAEVKGESSIEVIKLIKK